MNRSFCLLAFALSLLSALPSRAETANGCPPFEEARVTIIPLAAEPRFDHNPSLAEILAMADGDSKKYSSARHETPVGLTAASLKLDSRYKITTQGRSDEAMVCGQISDFVLRFGFEDTTVFLARELPRSSCGYRAVLAHELEHVAIDKEFVRSYQTPLSTILGDAIRRVGVVRAGSSEAVESRVREIMSDYIEDLSKNLAEVRERQQSALDTPEEYRRLSRVCDGQLGRLIANHASR